MAGSEPAAIEFRLLGSVEALRDGTALPLGGPRQRALLALLLVEGGPVSPDRLIEELWPRANGVGRSTLAATVSRLRSALPDEIELTSGAAGYMLRVDSDQLDAARFEHLVEEGREALARGSPRQAAERLREALALWRGEALAGVAADGRLRREVERLDDVRVQALEERIEADLQLGRSADLVEELEALVEDQPYRERPWRQLILALYRADRQADALAAYRRAHDLLDEELGVEPGEELQQLHRAILRHEVEDAAPQLRHNLPASLTSFVGRERELRVIERWLTESRLLTLTGVGGVGKTRVALQTAHRAVLDYPDGVWFVDLAALSEPGLVPQAVGTVLGVGEGPGTKLVDGLAERVRDARLLLVLDNCEHLRDACAALAHDLLRASPGLHVLATSREPLGAPGETSYPIPPLAFVADAGTQRPEAVQLFLSRARAARPALPDDDDALATIASICADLDGLPLAIELAAARARALSLDEIAARLDNRFRFLVSWRRLSTARHQTLLEAMEWSMDLLGEREQELLAQLSVFAGSFSLDAVAHVCLEGDRERALDSLERLVEASLVVAEERDGSMRYRLLETVRQYAAGRLDERATTQATKSAHVRYFCALAVAAVQRGLEQVWWLEQLDADLDNFRAAIDTAGATGDAESELRLVGALGRYWWIRGLVAEGRARIEAALARGKGMPAGLRTSALNRAAGLAWAQGDLGSARSLATQALELARAADDASAEVGAQNVLGITAIEQEDYVAARMHLSESLSLAERHGLADDADTAKLNLGIATVYSGDAESAVPILDELLTHARERDAIEGVGFAQLHLGLAAFQLGDHEGARASWDEARAVFAELGFPEHVGHALQGLAAVEARKGCYASAARLLGSADTAFADSQAPAKDFFGSRVTVYAEAEARAALGDEAFEAAFEAGAAH